MTRVVYLLQPLYGNLLNMHFFFCELSEDLPYIRMETRLLMPSS